MKICCLGSMNIDMVFEMDEFVKPKETVHSKGMNLYAGGKGLNQAIAMRKAGAEVYMAGSIGRDGDLIIEKSKENDLDDKYIRKIDGNTGIAMIQVDSSGENCIILYNGSNMQNDREYIDYVLSDFTRGDYLVLQNEINNLDYILKRADKLGLVVFLNPSPITKDLLELTLDLCDYLLVNEVEGSALAGGKTDSKEMIKEIRKKYGNNIILTMGSEGVYYNIEDEIYHEEAHEVEVRDTTGAGDAFAGYLIAMLARGEDLKEAVKIANKVGSVVVTKTGASTSIPKIEELEV